MQISTFHLKPSYPLEFDIDNPWYLNLELLCAMLLKYQDQIRNLDIGFGHIYNILRYLGLLIFILSHRDPIKRPALY